MTPILPPMHYAPAALMTACGTVGTVPVRVTFDPWDTTCRPCRTAMIAGGMCPECGQERLSWGTHPEKTSGVVDGRLTAHDVRTIFYLACDYCSETLLPRVDADEVAAALTAMRWSPLPRPAPTLPS